LTDLRTALLAFACALACSLAAATPAGATGAPSPADRIEELQQELDSLTEDVEDLQEPIAEFDLFDECAYTIGVSQQGNGVFGYAFGRGGVQRRPALSLDMRGFGTPTYWFLAFPAEEPPSIECNEDAGEEDSDD
jgi:hypothetical protein